MKKTKKEKQHIKDGPKMGISRRLFFYILFIVLGISGLIFLANTLLLAPLYNYSIKASMTDAIDNISKIDFTVNTDVWTSQLNSLTSGQDYDVIIKNETEVLYSSSVDVGLRSRPDNAQAGSGPEQNGGLTGPPSSGKSTVRIPNQQDQKFFIARNPGELESGENGIYYGTMTGRSGFQLIVINKDLGNGISVFITQPVEPINKGILQANILLAACTLLALAISAIIVFKVSKRFTKPITQIQSTVGDIAALDFSKKCDVKTGDELQSLGENVNRLGDELKDALDTLKAQNEKLEKDIIAQRQFISNASHELRTPLSLIKGYADEINTGYANDAEQKKFYIEIIAEEAAKMNRLLKEMLELTRMESGTANFQNEKLTVSESIHTFIEKYDGFISENSLKVTLDLPESGAEGFYDPVRFEQVLANYISNAARYGDDKKEINISAETTGDSIRISVFNTGKAISDDVMNSMWDGFSKADIARTRVADSYGLGLSVVKAIQNAAGQKFGAENVPGGVVFWFDVAKYNGQEK